eukprot:Rhum_TRINITY_DN16737_c0_g1::Rhum_TRINITY_DN16737_c0_g1_i1::g.164098::m.164098/K17609/NXN; nucleoredoxin
MAFFAEKLGAQILTKAGLRPTAEVLQGKKHVLAYLSAHWCPPCRRFTPEFAKFYSEHKEKHSFEVVFVSLDRSDEDFLSYYSEMPWTAIPYGSTERSTFASKFGGEGIPELLIFDDAGSLVTRNGVELVSTHKDAEGFPWAPPTFAEAMGDILVAKDGSTASVADTLKGKTVGVYCSAHWCGPCRSFTPELAKFYAEYKKVDPNFEIVFCSSDRSAADMDSYFKSDHGDWFGVPFDSPNRTLLQKLVNAEGIPTFAVYDAEGKLINKNGRAKVSGGVEAVAKDGWAPPLVGDLRNGPEVAGTDLNRAPAILLRVEGCDDDEQDSCFAALEVLAKEYAAKASPPDIVFFISKTKAGIAEQLTELTKKTGSKRCAMPDDEPLMLLFDIPSQGTYYESPAVDITPDSIRSFIDDCKNDRVKGLKLQR